MIFDFPGRRIRRAVPVHVRRSLRRHDPGFEVLAQPGARPFQGTLRGLKSVDEASSGFHVRKTKTSFFTRGGMRPHGLSHRCHTGTRALQYEGSVTIENHDVAFVKHSRHRKQGLADHGPLECNPT